MQGVVSKFNESKYEKIFIWNFTIQKKFQSTCYQTI